MSFKSLLRIGAAGLVLMAVSSAASLYSAKGGNLTLAGSTTVLPIAQRAAEVYMEQDPSVSISVRGGGSGVGVASLIQRNADIADCSRKMKAKEITLARQKGVNPVAHTIALDGILVVLHLNNPVKNLTISQLKDIFSGKVINWKDVGGPNLAIVPVSRDVASGTFEVFNEKVLKGGKVSGEAQMLASNKAVAAAIAETPGAVGYIGIAYKSDTVKTVTVDGITPSEETVKNQSYPLSRGLYMYTNGKPRDSVKKFIDFLLSGEGQKLVEEVGYISVR